MRPPRPDATKRDVTLRIGTYRRLRRYLDELRDETGLRGRSLTFDDAVGALLAEHEIIMAAGREALEECLRERFLGRDGRGPDGSSSVGPADGAGGRGAVRRFGLIRPASTPNRHL